ncbi:MAG: Ion channel [Pirellula sp.]|nr:Ion channel [Pirellula sp.]
MNIMNRHLLRRRFVHGLYSGLRLVWPILSSLLGIIVALGLTIGMLEGWTLAESIYFAFISSLTIGYGDFVPTTTFTRALTILIGLCGVLLTALLAAVAVKAMHLVEQPGGK